MSKTNYDLLKAKLLEKRYTYDDGAKAIGKSTTTFSDKMNGKSKFDVVEARKLKELLNMTVEEYVTIFLN